MSTYRAIQVTSPGRMELVTRRLVDPGPGRVRLRVEACGICHTDSITVDGGMPGISYPRVPGHEVIGRIDALGEGVSGWKIGQRVGVGLLAGHCGVCAPCRRGDFVDCANQPMSGVHHDGGYAESVIAIPSGLASIPDNFSSADAAPMLCAGVTMFNALRRSSAEPGDLVAVQGVGGLGHLAVQFAARMGFRVAAIARGPEKEEFARQLGADHYIDSKAGDPVAALQALGGAKVIVATASDSKSMSELFGGLALRGRMIVAGAGNSPIEVSPMLLLFGSRGIEGTLTGSSFDSEETLTFSLLHKVKPMIETVPLEQAAEGYQRMLSNKARFRMVIVMGQ